VAAKKRQKKVVKVRHRPPLHTTISKYARGLLDGLIADVKTAGKPELKQSAILDRCIIAQVPKLREQNGLPPDPEQVAREGGK
jgi:hypothetical protein